MEIKQSLKDKNKLWVHYQGRTYCLKEELAAEEAEAASENLTAPFTCKIVKFHVQEKQSLKAGDLVVTVEAMKMEYNYQSPKDGVVAKILVKEGDIVHEDDRFFEWQE